MKIKLFVVNWNGYYESVIQKILNNEFTDVSNEGFVSNRYQKEEFEAEYVKLFEYKDNIKHPLTQETIQNKRIRLERTSIDLFNSVVGLVMYAPTKNYKEIVEKISFFSNYRISISNSGLDINDLLYFLEKSNYVFSVSGIETDASFINDTTKSKITLINIRRDVREDYCKYFDCGKYRIKKIKCSLKVGDRDIKFEIDQNYNIVVHKGQEQPIVSLISEYLGQA